MKAITLLLLLSSFALRCFATGGTTVGNGGDAVVCPTSIQLLDFYELQLYSAQTPDYVSGAGSPIEKAAKVIARLKSYSPLLGEKFEAELSTFFARTTFVTTDLVDVPDSMHVVFPVGCKVGQLAIQKTEGGLTTYIIDKKLWDRLSPVDQAGLIVHELIYTEMIASGQLNSISTRELNSYLFTNGFEDRFNHEWFVDFLIRGGMNHLVSYPVGKSDLVMYNSKSRDYGNRNRDRVTAQLLGCGFRVQQQILAVDFCAVDGTGERLLVNAFDDLHRIISVNDTASGRWIYNSSAPEIGLPFSLISFDLDDNRPGFLPLDDYPFQSRNLDITCLGGKLMGFTGHYVDVSEDKSEFHFNTGDVNFCSELKAGSRALVPLAEKPTWVSVNRLLSNLDGKISVKFSQNVDVNILGSKFQAESFKDGKLTMGLTSDLKIDGRVVNTKQIYWYEYDTENKCLEFSAFTDIFINGVKLNLGQIRYCPSDPRKTRMYVENDQYVNIYDPKTKKITRRDSWHLGAIAPYKPGVFVEAEFR